MQKKLLIFVLFVFVTAAFAWLKLQERSQVGSTAVNQAATQELPIITNYPRSKYVLKVGENLFLLKPDKSLKQVTFFAENGPTSFAFHQESGFLSYERTGEEGVLYLQNLYEDSTKPTKVDLSAYKRFPKRNLHVGTNIMEDGKTVIIVVERTILKYLWSEKKLEVISSDVNVNMPIAEDPYGLSTPPFYSGNHSPNNQQLLISELVHEGGRYFVYDLEAKQFFKLPLEGGLHDQYFFLGWVNDETLLLSEHHDEENTDLQLRNKAIVSEYSIKSGAKKVLYQSDVFLGNVIVTPTHIFAITEKGLLRYDRRSRKEEIVLPHDPSRDDSQIIMGADYQKSTEELFLNFNSNTKTSLLGIDVSEGNVKPYTIITY